MAITDIALACQGGGSHAAFTAGALPMLLSEFRNVEIARSGRDGVRQDMAIHARNLVGISGTSGGAISALLGWYGFIIGGAAEAEAGLARFWEANSAIKFAEASDNLFWRNAADWTGQECDIKWTPYGRMFALLDCYHDQVWRQAAALLDPDRRWMRGEYFDLQALLQPMVNWKLIEAIGDFTSIPFEVERWTRSKLERDLFSPPAACRDRYLSEQSAAEERISRKLDAGARIQALIRDLALPEDSLLHLVFSRWRRPDLRLDWDGLHALAKSVRELTYPIPRLLLGAVELHKGEFTCFSSERAPSELGICLDTVMASAALPTLFKARLFAGTDPQTLKPRRFTFWDGLFSQNPPIRDFLAQPLDGETKPDEIWLVQIHPDEARAGRGARRRHWDHLDLSGGEIWARRDALSGNLALNQEVAFVEAINRRIAAAAPAAATPATDGAPPDKLVQVDRIVMDVPAVEAAGVAIGANSRYDRSRVLKEALYRHGQLQGRRYLELRERLSELCGSLGTNLAGACGSAAQLAPDAAEASFATWARELGPVTLVGATLHSVRTEDAEHPQAIARWRSGKVSVGGRPLFIEGETELCASPNPGTDWRVKDVRITCVAQAKA